MARRYNPYWVTEKWVYDKAARRRALKALGILGNAERFLLTHGPEYGEVELWEELAYEDAFDILRAASARVEFAEKAAHMAAKARLDK